MARYTVILGLVGYFFGDTEDNTILRTVTAETPEIAVINAQELVAGEFEVCPVSLANEGGAHAVMPVLYVFEGVCSNLLAPVCGGPIQAAAD